MTPEGGKVKTSSTKMDANEIKNILKRRFVSGPYSVFIPEYTWNSVRIDALVIDTKKRWIRGFEIKTSRNDFVSDDKWLFYTEFCSSLSFVCPEGIIKPEEVRKPFGLLWIVIDDTKWARLSWKKRPQKLQNRNSLSWLWTYANVLEKEVVRLDREMDALKKRIEGQGYQRRI